MFFKIQGPKQTLVHGLNEQKLKIIGTKMYFNI